jgi:lipopolysaccharide transport system ATP-binding protein
MSNAVIKVENLGKQYRLGQVGTGTIAHDFNRWWHRVRGKEDPYLKIGEVNDRSSKGNSNLVWALKDINFEVKQGEVLGIIGKNGAGKSTLLKILSRVTAPTIGDIKVKGRIASLLEVGTGFHPELTGRENIFLNGAILGMTKKEIKSKFDEIVAFSGVERYIDTPVKRYSSGMYVRLAFAVAAHLEPEILIVDEVLAVGDQEFQDKCLGKMKDVSGQGRTVLFVSHNMSAIKLLCDKALSLRNGQVFEMGNTAKIVDLYLSEGVKKAGERNLAKGAVNIPGLLEMQKLSLTSSDGNIKDQFEVTDAFFINVEYEVFQEKYCYSAHFYVKNSSGEVIFVSMDNKYSPHNKNPHKVGKYKQTLHLPKNFFNEGSYNVEALICTFPTQPVAVFCTMDFALSFKITDNYNEAGSRANWTRNWPNSIVRPDFEWGFKKL